MGGSQPSLSGNDVLPKVFFPGPQAQKAPPSVLPRANAKSTFFHWESTFPDHPAPAAPAPSSLHPTVPSSTVRPAGEEELAPPQINIQAEALVMNILAQCCLLFTRVNGRLASASATWAQRTAAQTSKRLPWGESPAVWMAGGRRGRAAGKGEGEGIRKGRPRPRGRREEESGRAPGDQEKLRLAGKPPRREGCRSLGWTEHHPVRREKRTACV